MNNEIKITELTWKPEKDQSAILAKICTEFTTGGFYGILGPNGSGKTSLMKHILRLIETKSDSLSIDGTNLNSLKRSELARKIALVPQNTNIETAFTVMDIVMMGRAPYQKKFSQPTAKDIELVRKAMEMTNCYELRDKIFSNLSGGEAQRAITARAIAQQTPWLVLDEPIAHLDIRYQVELMQHLTMLNEQEHRSILAVLHDLNLAAQHCKQIVLMKQGQIVAAGPTSEVMTVENLNYVYDMNFYQMQHPILKCPYFIPVGEEK